MAKERSKLVACCSSGSQMPPSRDLIIVCCHAVYHGGARGNPHDETTWALQPFQRSHGLKQGEHLTFLKHMEAAFAVVRHDNAPAIVFSGGCTNPKYPHLSEARSYLDAASALSMDNDREVLLEELATDSYQNLVFSIAVFTRKFGHYPSNISVVTHEFKRKRFRDLHAKAICWPEQHFNVMGINPPFSDQELQMTIDAERHNYALWELDPYGTGSVLSSKREKRRWEKTHLEQVTTGVEDVVVDLLRWTGDSTGSNIFPLGLPWNQIKGV